MRTISISIPGDPVAKGRARAFVRQGRVAHYTPDKTARYENLVRLAARDAMAGATPTEAAVALSVVAWFPIPTSWSKRRQVAALEGREFHVKRPDLDNVIKAIKDGCNGVVWRDDSQVARLVDCAKRYSDRPRVDVIVAELTE